MQTIIDICLRKNKSKQSYVWIDSTFEAQNICSGSETAGLLDHSYNKCALEIYKISDTCFPFRKLKVCFTETEKEAR